MRKSLVALSTVCFLLALIILLASPAYLSQVKRMLFNADHLYPFSVYETILNPGAPPEWIFGGYTPFFELLLGFFTWLPIRNLTLTFAVYTILQQGFIVAALVYCYRGFFSSNQKITALVLLSVTVQILFFAAGYLSQAFYFFFWYIHATTTPMILIALGALVRFCARERAFSGSLMHTAKNTWSNLLVLWVVCSTTTMSDALFIPQFIVPAVLVIIVLILFSIVSFRKGAVAAINMLYATALGLALYRIPTFWGSDRVVLNGTYMKLSWSLVVQNTQAVFRLVSSIWNGHWTAGLAWFSFYIACIFLVLLKISKGRQRSGKVLQRSLFGLLFFPFQLITSLAAIMTAMEPSQRYILPAVAMPFFWGWPFLAAQALPHMRTGLSSKFWWVGASMLVVVLVTLAGRVGNFSAFTSLIDYYPEEARCMDENAARFGLHSGLAQYWLARPLTLQSRKGISVVQITPDLTPYPILSNSSAYRYPMDFIIIDNDPATSLWIKKELVIQHFGTPAASFFCGVDEFLVYNRSTDVAFRDQFLHLARFSP